MQKEQSGMALRESPSFEDDIAFLNQHTQLVILRSEDGKAKVAVAPDYQARVMTSTAGEPLGLSHGYLHRPGIVTGQRQPRITVLGGEDRFWLGPEAGPYALYFAPGEPFDLHHWQVPEPLDWGPWHLVTQSSAEARFQTAMALTNYAGTRLELAVTRAIRVLGSGVLREILGSAQGANTSVVGYESDNVVRNTGSQRWRKDTGLASIWILGMFKPGPRTTVVLPFREDAPFPRAVNDLYFGRISRERMRVEGPAVLLRADGTSRGKVGLSWSHARNVAGSYDPDCSTLTLVTYTVPAQPELYANSLWELQADPYSGDVVNAYNDGPGPAGELALGPFYELESSSPARELEPLEELRHVHRTLHAVGPETELNAIAERCLGLSLAQIRGPFEPV